jgi:hypothetical protein
MEPAARRWRPKLAASAARQKPSTPLRNNVCRAINPLVAAARGRPARNWSGSTEGLADVRDTACTLSFETLLTDPQVRLMIAADGAAVNELASTMRPARNDIVATAD